MASMRVACDKKGKGNSGKSDGNESGGQATVTRVMVTEGKQQSSTSNGINKGGQWLARERQQGNHTTMTVGNNKGREHAADDDGSNKEGKGGQGDGDGNEGGGQQRGQGQ